MSNAPVRATPRPLLHGLVEMLHAWFGPSSERHARRARFTSSSAALRIARPATRREAALDVPTYQRRGIRIPGLDEG
jgi:hypothetical protein